MADSALNQKMAPEIAASELVISLEDAVLRLDGIETISAGTATLTAAVPLGYASSRRLRYPLLLLLEASDLFGSAVEMSRLLASSREVRKTLVVNASGVAAGDSAGISALVQACCRRYRIDAKQVAVFGAAGMAQELLTAFGRGIDGVSRCIVATPGPIQALLSALPQGRAGALAWTVLAPLPAAACDRDDIVWKHLPEASPAGMAVPALIHGLRSFWGSGHRYGDEVLLLAKPLAERSLRLLAPLLRPLTKRKVSAADTSGTQVRRAQMAARDFEVFVALPEGASLGSGRRYPTVVALDANGCFATVAETAARMAQAGEIAEAIVIGIGTPRSQGDLEFAFRRFEELSPPLPPEDRREDVLARFFRALFLLRGEDARRQLGQAPAFHDFIARELLPELMARLPIAADAVTLLGHSAAGAFVGYALGQPSSPFSSFICLSPGTAISDDWMLRNLPTPRPEGGQVIRVFAALGAEEMDNPFNKLAGIPQTLTWATQLQQQRGHAVECHNLQGETHTTVYARALSQGLRALLAVPDTQNLH